MYTLIFALTNFFPTRRAYGFFRGRMIPFIFALTLVLSTSITTFSLVECISNLIFVKTYSLSNNDNRIFRWPGG